LRLFVLPSALRRLAASLMLAALASFVLHGARDGGAPSRSRSQPTASAAHSHGAAAGHEHAHGHAHGPTAHDHGGVHAHPGQADAGVAVEDGDDASRGHHAKGAEGPCCGSACAVAIPAFAPGMISAPMTAAAVLLPAGQDGVSIDPNGLKRPPRTPCIA
jgi:hypothetical protein